VLLSRDTQSLLHDTQQLTIRETALTDAAAGRWRGVTWKG
jgi:hypothetical protein